jgi:serine/threonine-protein kinase HipA
MDNTDDYEKNHALVFTDPGVPRLAPAFDMLPACQNLGYQQVGVGDKGAESSLESALSSHKAFRQSNRQAMAEIKAVAQVVDGWQAHFLCLGVGERDIELLHASIDRHFLRDQRQWALR